MSKIVRLQSENIKRVVAVDITPSGNTVVISGKNEQGKTSVLDSIAWAFEGARAVDEVPIRAGAEEGHIRVELEDLVIEKKFTAKGQALKVMNKEGARFSSPQEMLDKFLGAISFEPLRFIKLKPSEQYDTLSKLIQFDFNLARHEDEQKADYERRTDVNRRVSSLAAEVEALKAKLPKEGEPTPEPVDVMELVRKRDDFAQKKVTCDEYVRRAANLATHGNNVKAQLEAARAEVTRLEAVYSKAVADAEELTAAMEEYKKTLPSEEEIEKVSSELDASEEKNASYHRHVATVEELTKKEAEHATAAQQSETLTKRMAEREEAKKAAIAAVKMPVEGLELKEGKVFYNGFPLSQASGAAQLRVSMAIAMAANPKLRVIRVKDASLLDESNMALIREMADAHDFQIWLEVVDSKDPMAVIIEDGRVKGAKEPEQKTEAANG